MLFRSTDEMSRAVVDDYTPSVGYFREFFAVESDGVISLYEARAEFDRMIAQVRAEALREAHADLQAYTDSGAPFGHRPVEEFLLRRADRIEKESGL